MTMLCIFNVLDHIKGCCRSAIILTFKSHTVMYLTLCINGR